jgi:2-polyprenyl-3-methyl-5-hydroxy-6-metoxy-1,4-benzoquinol methylase
MSCRSCGSTELRDLGPCAPVPDRLSREIGMEPGQYEAGRLLRCRRCGLGQRQPCLQEHELVEAYRHTPSETMGYAYEDNCAWMKAREFLVTRWQKHETPLRVLDIGCHTGAFLAGLPRPWQRFGIESAEEPIRIAAEQGVEIVSDRVETVDVRWNGQFDAVTLFDVVEHLADPAAGLGRAGELLRPGGVLIASTADLDAWTWKLTAGRHWYLQAPLHLSIASREFFRYVAAAGGLRFAKFERVAHRRGSLGARVRERAELIHWESRQRGGLYRIPQRLLQGLPGLRELRHRDSVPWAMRLKDHLFVVLERTAEA